jgi:hypothetical protein
MRWSALRSTSQLALAIALLIAGSPACGGLADESPGAPSADAASIDATPDSTLADSSGDEVAARDASAEASPLPDAVEGPDSPADASTNEAGDGGDASAPDATACNNACVLGDQQCTPRLPDCTFDDAGIAVGCWLPNAGTSTCIHGDAGCTVWGSNTACMSNVACCVPCTSVKCDDGGFNLYCSNCPLGGYGSPCAQDTDCAGDACDAVTHTCITNQCADHRQDGQESDIDCGGIDCNACTVGQRCHSSFDCWSGHRCNSSHVCQ